MEFIHFLNPQVCFMKIYQVYLDIVVHNALKQILNIAQGCSAVIHDLSRIDSTVNLLS